jgi:exodeoxyribonuclease VII large subunit
MTGRLPFRAGDLRRDAPAKADSDSVISVSALAGMLDAAVREGTPSKLRVVGEISGFRDRTHWYFDLKDAEAVVQCVVFASSARKLGFVPENGQEVVASGRIDYYAKSGKVSLIATGLEPVGAGAQDLAYQKLVKELRELGWFSQDRKRALPFFPRRIAVLTSRSSAAYQDVLDTAKRRCSAVEILLVDVRVQGEAATPEIAQAIRDVGRLHGQLGVDAILVTRGGGSKEDLWCFNERVVAEAVVDSPIPVVAAIGHETDTTIAELAADVRAATPTQAVMRLVPDASALDEQVLRQEKRLWQSHLRLMQGLASRLDAIGSRPIFRKPGAIVAQRLGELDAFTGRLVHAERQRLSAASLRVERLSSRLERIRPDRVASRKERRNAARLSSAEQRLIAASRSYFDKRRFVLMGLSRELEAVSPIAVLERGYSVTLDARGKAVRSIGDLSVGDTIETRLADGSAKSVVGESDASRKPARRRARKQDVKDEKDQLDLFGGGR